MAHNLALSGSAGRMAWYHIAPQTSGAATPQARLCALAALTSVGAIQYDTPKRKKAKKRNMRKK
jgi:hypothetical protein